MERYDQLEQRCRMLGHTVPFGYCRSMNQNLPCRLIMDCWHEKLDIAVWLNKHFSQADLQKAFAPPKPKILSIVELIEKARQVDDAPGCDSPDNDPPGSDSPGSDPPASNPR